MNTIAGSTEIVESMEESESEAKLDGNNPKNKMVRPGQKYSIEDDINKLFEAIDIKNTRKVLGQQSEYRSKDALNKSAMKRPMRVGSTQASGIGISESVSLKQALRGLCISQASEMAAMKKRLSRSTRSSGVSEAGTIKRLYRAVVVEANESGHPLNEGKGNLVEITLLPESSTSSSFKGNMPTSAEDHIYSNADVSSILDPTTEVKLCETLPEDEIVSVSTAVCSDLSDAGLEQHRKIEVQRDSVGKPTEKEDPLLCEIVPASTEVPIEPVTEKEREGKLGLASCSSIVDVESKVSKLAINSPRIMKPLFRSKSFVKKKIITNSTLSSSYSQQSSGGNNDMGGCNGEVVCQASDSTLENVCGDNKVSPETSSSKPFEISSKYVASSASKPSPSSYCKKTKNIVSEADERSRSREKGEISQSSKSSIGDYSSTTSVSEESYLSMSSRSGCRPHMSKDLRWKAIQCVQKQFGHLGLKHFKLLRKLGGGDIGNVYLSELISTNCLFALKVMDNEFLASRDKMPRAQTEREILQMLDHPFLPSLYTHFISDKFSCLVIEYCPGGDLHVLRQKQPSKSFSEQAARFYVAEVLLALEYLHMLGVVYRDLKPENVLIREDGHIMLTDFDLSLRCAVNLTLVTSSSPTTEPRKKMPSPCSESSCIDPFCLHPSWQMSCFNPRFLSAASRTRKLKSELAAQVSPLPQLIVEPTSARSNSFVGTHEYLAPEIIKGDGHGSAVDWWTLGIFLYELLYGKTPFKGTVNEDTLSNVASECLKFPENPIVSSNARDLIRRLLQKEPENRLGSEKGAAEIKQHPFFEGLNWALIRCATPPELPRYCDVGNLILDIASQDKENGKNPKECRTIGEDIVFEMF
ncbi:hypothetical protein M9H77_16471 [Catharanthus roseus]|uniref:Uncharacterized protein n=1 Tax=Catharanthus roseus TaxID=4058 RepID=A0ACC0B1U7_CATRO|nr:hypothetical protein M9H77_16471 [Catharanthus roseus]